MNSKEILKNCKKLASILLLVIFAVSNLQGTVFAQEEKQSETVKSGEKSIDSIEALIEYAPGLDEEVLNPLNLEGLENIDSNKTPSFKEERRVKKLTKTSFQAKEEIEVVVDNVDESEVDNYTVEITNERIGEIETNVEKDFANGELVLGVTSKDGVMPGIYDLKVIDESTGEMVSNQGFSWGVLAINTDKSIYLPGEKADIAIAVLDENGRMVCDANVDLEITEPWGEKTNLTTENGKIKVNDECRYHAVTTKPDYETSFTTTDVGRYLMHLSATTENGTYVTRDRFEVRSYVPFDIQRKTATRVYPLDDYPVEIKIKANENFKGKIVEAVPVDFQIKKLELEEGISYSTISALPDEFARYSKHNIPDLRLPFDGEYPVTLGFGQQIEGHDMELAYKEAGLDGHDGVDFGLPKGTDVVAVDAGEVILAEEDWVYGSTVVIQHKWGRSYYGHLSEIRVKTGTQVQKDTKLGESGSTGLSTGPHLHFGIKPLSYVANNLYYGKIDPAPYLGISNEDPVLSVSEYPLNSRALIFEVDLKKGEEIVLGYKYKSPEISPFYYTLGPLQFITSDVDSLGQEETFDVKDSEGSELIDKFVLGDDDQGVEEQLVFSEIRLWQLAIDDTTVLTSGTSWNVPSDWNDANNIIEVIGAGGGGGGGGTSPLGAGGGGGGAGGVYAISSNVDLPEGASVTYAIGAGGGGGGVDTNGTVGGDTYFCNSTSNCASIAGTAVVVGGKGGGLGSGGSGAAGGTTQPGSVGDSTNNGGNGGTGAAASSKDGGSGGGGGGAGGLNGAGGTGGSPATTANGGTGGTGDNGTGGTGGTGGTYGATCSVGGTGNAGTEWVTAGSGGGGGGGGGGTENNNGCNGGAGGNYGSGGGGGGGAGKKGTSAGGGSGIQGVIIINYTVAGPTLNQIMRHGKWYDGTSEQPFTF